MQLLPPIHCGDQQWRLPLSDYTAAQVSTDLHSFSAEDSAFALERTLADDPALTLWIVSFAWTTAQHELTTFAEAAQWMNYRRWRLIASGLDAVESGQARKCGVRCGATFLASLTAQAVSGSGLIGPLGNAADWFTACGPRVDPRSATLSELLPASLATASDSTCLCTPAQQPAPDTVRRTNEKLERWRMHLPFANQLLVSAVERYERCDAEDRQADQQRLKEKLASLKEFAYGASHELNNPLFNISSRAQVLLRDEQDPQRRQKLATIYSHAMRASEMISDIALAARGATPTFAEVDAVAIVREVVEELTPLARQQATTLNFDTPMPSLMLIADATQLTILAREICINALESIKRADRSGTVNVCLATRTDDSLELTITDDGPGLDERSRRHLFDPFFSGYESGRGFGFGLTKCWQIVEAHGGTIAVSSRPGAGTTLRIQLPRRQTSVRDLPGSG